MPDRFEVQITKNKPKAVFICNSPLHVYNAIQAAYTWQIDIKDCMLVLKIVSKRISLTPALESLVEWHSVIRIPPFPVPPRLKETGYKKMITQYKFFKKWQRELGTAVGCQYVFLCHNRQADNKVIASYLKAKELIWLEDGTLSYSLWQEERILTEEQRLNRLKKRNSNASSIKNQKSVVKKAPAKAVKKVPTKTASKKSDNDSLNKRVVQKPVSKK